MGESSYVDVFAGRLRGVYRYRYSCSARSSAAGVGGGGMVDGAVRVE